ncbi:hypothetical protein KSP40_PGU021763 [Platanthera guangdongensis]|uniref:Oxidoreductase FAD/NAD(P)-binding domain-containing protein n=1 Tax=Platanthera guangdongensis TaxID=2320717 RepID=A0ABR2M3D2_9ASPA
MKEKAPDNFRLDFAVSREQTNNKGEKMYIQTRMAEYAEELWSLLKKDNTFVYMCGLKGMEKGIDDIMVSLAAKDADVKGGRWWNQTGQREPEFVTLTFFKYITFGLTCLNAQGSPSFPIVAAVLLCLFATVLLRLLLPSLTENEGVKNDVVAQLAADKGFAVALAFAEQRVCDERGGRRLERSAEANRTVRWGLLAQIEDRVHWFCGLGHGVVTSRVWLPNRRDHMVARSASGDRGDRYSARSGCEDWQFVICACWLRTPLHIAECARESADATRRPFFSHRPAVLAPTTLSKKENNIYYSNPLFTGD